MEDAKSSSSLMCHLDTKRDSRVQEDLDELKRECEAALAKARSTYGAEKSTNEVCARTLHEIRALTFGTDA